MLPRSAPDQWTIFRRHLKKAFSLCQTHVTDFCVKKTLFFVFEATRDQECDLEAHITAKVLTPQYGCSQCPTLCTLTRNEFREKRRTVCGAGSISGLLATWVDENRQRLNVIYRAAQKSKPLSRIIIVSYCKLSVRLDFSSILITK